LRSLRLHFIYFTTFNGLSIIIFLQKQDLRILGRQTLHSAYQLPQQRNTSSLRWTTVKRMSKLQHIKVNETENRTKLQHILSSEIQDQVTASNLDNNKNKNHITAHTPDRNETQHQVTWHKAKDETNTHSFYFKHYSIWWIFNEMLANVQCTICSFATPYKTLHLQ